MLAVHIIYMYSKISRGAKLSYFAETTNRIVLNSVVLHNLKLLTMLQTLHSIIGKSQREDAYLYVFSAQKLFGTGVDGGTGGHHVVDNHQMLALNLGSVGKLESIGNIFLSLPVVELSLACNEAVAP